MGNFAENFNDYGIHGISMSGNEEQRVVCPECVRRKGNVREKDLAVNVEKGTWFCQSANCGWKGGLRKERIQTFAPVQSKAVPLVDNNYKFFEARGIPKSVVDRNRITKDKIFIQAKEKNEPVICFNYYVGDVLVNIKYRTVDKHFSQVKGGSKVFYKLNDTVGKTDCIITEGEMDALSFEVADYLNAISVPDGAVNPNVQNISTKLSYLDNNWDYFENMKKIYLATDSDAPGIRLREELARRLGKARCWIVKFPDDCKDANEVLMKHGKDVLKKCVENAELYPIEGIHYANEYTEEFNDLYDYGYPNGAKSGWTKFDEHIRFYDSCMTVITGVPSHGKSNFMDHLMVRLAVKNGWKFGVFSPENATPKIHMHRLAEILIGLPFIPGYSAQMTREDRDKARFFINDHFIFINPPDENFTMSNILELAAHAVLKHGIKGLILDPWNTIVHEYDNEKETDYTAKALNRLLHFERNHGLHLFIIAHPAKMRRRKDSMKYEIPALYDISGSAHWYNKAEVGITIWREFSEDNSKTLYNAAIVQKVKHKYMGRLGTVKFDFDAGSQRFYEKDEIRQEGPMIPGCTSQTADEYKYSMYNNGDDDDEDAF